MAVCPTYNLELDGHNAEVENLNGRPYDVVCLQSRYVDVLELASHGALSSALSHRHESEEASKT